MGFYGNKLIIENTQLLSETGQIIENNFAFLNEASDITVIKRKIEELKKKENITNKDIDALANDIKKITDEKEKSDMIIMLVSLVIGFVTLQIGTITFKDIYLVTSLLFSLFSLSKSSSLSTNPKGYKVYTKIIKLEAKINIKIKKIQALEKENDENKELLKELNKSLEIINKLKPAYKNKLVNRESSIEESVLLEFKGNKNKTEAFKIIIEEMAGLSEFNYKKIQLVKKTIDEMISDINQAIKAKDTKTTGELAIKIRELGNKANKDIDNLTKEYGTDYPLSLAVFKKDLKSFTVKYSEITMADKERIADKLQTLEKKIYEIGSAYSSSNKSFKEKIDKLNDDIDKAGKRGDIGDAMTSLYSWLNYIVQECNLTANDIKLTIADLKIEKTKNSFIYKVLNPIKK